MKTEAFFVIKEGYSPLFYFTNLEKATEMFKNLCDGGVVKIEKQHVDQVVKKDKNGWRDYDELSHITGKSEFTLAIEYIKVYEKKEIDEIKKEREKKIKELDKK